MSNNRFKFRAWDKRKKRYVDCYVIEDDGRAYQLHCAVEDSYDLIPDEDVIIEQCIGLTDKHGKLIYEGDVVIGSWNTKLIVFWDAISASYRVKPLDNCGGDRELHYYSNVDGIVYYNFEVIGNIHEMEVTK